jgi:hypothetical protein
MNWLDAVVEHRIEQAIAEGALDDLPGVGKPLALDDDSAVPEELRAAYRLLRNSGHVPPEVEALREIADLGALLGSIDDESARRRTAARLALLQTTLERRGTTAAIDSPYAAAIAARIAGGDPTCDRVDAPIADADRTQEQAAVRTGRSDRR